MQRQAKLGLNKIMHNTHHIGNKMSKREVHCIYHFNKHIKPFEIKFTRY